MEDIIILDHASYRYPQSNEYTLRDISLKIKKGEFVALMGENGAGKTTLCQLLTGIIPKSQGGKLLGKVVIAGMNTLEHDLAVLSQKIGIVLDDPETQLFTTKVLSEVAFGAENIEMSKEKILESISWALKVVRMEGYEKSSPRELSGGQKQRVAIATALVTKPDILILDEPTSQLDPIGTVEVFGVVRELKEKYGMTIVLSSHKSEEIVEFADKVIVLHQGELLAFGKPEDVLNDEEIVKKAWLRLPQVTEFSHYLRNRGMKLNKLPFTVDQAVETLEETLLWK
jgi:energy-coupling factor transporter ATP-binding protein EcfA2